MSLNSYSFSQVLWKQVKWKLSAHSQALNTLIIIQIMIVFLGFNASSMSGTGFNGIHLSIHFYSLDVMVFIACIWAFITALLLQRMDYFQDDFAVVTTRFVSNISNSIVLVFYSFIATIITIVSLYIFVVSIQLFTQVELIADGLLINPIQMLVAFSILLLAASSGFFVGALFSFSKILGIVIIGLWIAFINSLEGQLATVLIFFFEEGYLLFIIKAIVLTIILMSLSTLLLSRKEVVRR
ncbi:hypothetical protein D7X33_25880 [Butyricicoccus sp. 1XD8-22]|nr:hypothetical protein D7X33_25880 [Butyricicoccus sp. 1XD8-22]